MVNLYLTKQYIILNQKRIVSSINDVGKAVYPYADNSPKLNLKWIKDLHKKYNHKSSRNVIKSGRRDYKEKVP